ncbi:MAG TPA: cytochrome c oxidase subunit I [Candidatus Binataceae bacterium]|nr:cytochrome c oxidase subunit I [Candidatus Binataceae bacterium]
MAGTIDDRLVLTSPDSVSTGDVALPLIGRLHEWVITVDHKRLGLMYIGGGLIFFIVAGLQAATIRLQLAIPDAGIVSPQVFNRLLTLHGTAMVFLVGMPILTGFFNYLMPLMIGARDLAFPRLNAFGFWLWFFGALLLYFSYIGGGGMEGAGSAPSVGWFAYAPLTEAPFSRGYSTDYWILSVLLASVGSTATAVNLIATAFSMRCPGMTLNKMPVLVWLGVVDAGLMLVTLPPLSAAQIMLLLDRYLGAHFFDTQAGGSALLWQHFFWIFGHPEVYVLVIPAFAFASEIIPVFSRKVIFGYEVMVAASCAIGFLSLGVWAHHMFSVGMTPAGNAFFVTSSMLVGIPTGIKIFNWLGTMWGGRIRLRVPMLFAIAFLFQFLIAGLTGILLAVAPFDWQLTDTYFVVAHFHYVLIGGIVFMIFSAIHYWFPKATGRMLDERLGQWHFWLFLIGFHLTFDTLHFAGFAGMARRIYTYQPGRGLEGYNLLASIGVIFQALGVAVFLLSVVKALISGKAAGKDPWDAWTLEWSTESPPPEYNFGEVPTVHSRRPLWDLKHPDDPDWLYE